jgi:hypothetical protein
MVNTKESTFTIMKPEKVSVAREALREAQRVITRETSILGEVEEQAQALGTRPGWITEVGTLNVLLNITVDRLAQLAPVEEVTEMLVEAMGVIKTHAREQLVTQSKKEEATSYGVVN